jgi:hypothetical protein
MLQGVVLPALYWPADKVGAQTPSRLRPGDLSLVDYNHCHIRRTACRNPPLSCLARQVSKSFWIRSSENLLDCLQEVMWATK